MPGGRGREKVRKFFKGVGEIAHGALKDSKIISSVVPKLARMAGAAVGQEDWGDKLGTSLAAQIAQRGYGRPQRGRGMRSKLKKFLSSAGGMANQALKDTKYISNNTERFGRMAGAALGQEELGADIGRSLAAQAMQRGYGLNLAGTARQSGMGRKYRRARKVGGSTSIVGSRAQVWHGTKSKTTGGLSKADLLMNKHGRIVSARKHALGKSVGLKHLTNAGFTTKKGTFKLFPKRR